MEQEIGFDAFIAIKKHFRWAEMAGTKEVVLVKKYNLYFSLHNVKTKEDLDFKMIAYCSRSASKHFDGKFRSHVRSRLNSYFKRKFTEEQWREIYTRFGNGCNEALCRLFIQHGLDLGWLEAANKRNW